jgi:ABC-type sulfate/molybdate transport systems ATPase subunit
MTNLFHLAVHSEFVVMRNGNIRETGVTDEHNTPSLPYKILLVQQQKALTVQCKEYH